MTEGPTPRDPRDEPPREPLGGPEAPVDQPPPDHRPADTTPGAHDAPAGSRPAPRPRRHRHPGRHRDPGPSSAPPPPPPRATRAGASSRASTDRPRRLPAARLPAARRAAARRAAAWLPAAARRAVSGRQRHGRERRLGPVVCAHLAHRPDLLPGRQAPRGPLPRHAVDRLRGALDPGRGGPALHAGPIGALLGLVLFAFFIGWIVLMIQGFQGKHFKLPVIGDFAEQQAGRPGI